MYERAESFIKTVVNFQLIGDKLMTQFLLQACWWVPLYGLIGAILTLPWSTGTIRKTGPETAAYFNLLMTVLAFIHGSVIFTATWDQPPHNCSYTGYKQQI